MALLELRSLTFGYGKHKVIDSISFEVEAGDFTGLIGPNGAGKTTLFKIISRIISPWSGSVAFNGSDVSGISRIELAKKVAVMPQLLETHFFFTVEEFVLMGRFPHMKRWQGPSKNDLDAVERAIELCDLKELINQPINELSGGERQRAMLAQTLAQEPQLILLDEPTAHLDIGHQCAILDLLKKLNRDNNLTVLVVLHDLNLASEYCSKLVLLNKGKIHTIGAPKEVLTYQNIEEAYKTVVVVKDNPLSSKPHIFPISKEKLQTPLPTPRR